MEVYYTHSSIHNSWLQFTTLLEFWHKCNFHRFSNTTANYTPEVTAGKYTSYLFAFQNTTNSLLLKLSFIQHTAISIATSPFTLLCYYGNDTNSLLYNSNCYVTMELPQTHCYATATVTLLWKRYRMHRPCYQGKPNMSHCPLLTCPIQHSKKWVYKSNL
jgi:hypothetical protein